MRTYNKKTERGTTPKEVIEEAVGRVRNGSSVRAVAKDLQICYVTLSRYVKKAQETNGVLVSVGYAKKSIFSREQTEELVKYLKYAAKIYFGLSPKEVRKLTFECAVTFGIKVPDFQTLGQEIKLPVRTG